MSHFPVVVCLPPMDADKVPDALSVVLAPYDENLETEPYREYIEDAPKVWESAVKYFSENPDGKPAGLDELNTVAVLSAYSSTEVFEEHPEDSPAARYYSMSTYNPKSKWDWWSVGGRWGRYFHVKDGCATDPELIRGERRWDGPAESAENRYLVDGGRRSLLDFDAQRAAAAKKAGEEHDRWTALVDGLPEALPWGHFVARVRDDADPFTIEMARSAYGQQDRADLSPDAAPACGTTMCVAGWAAHLTGWTLGSYSRAYKDGVGRFIENVAADALGFERSDMTTVPLFHMPADKALAELRTMAGR